MASLTASPPPTPAAERARRGPGDVFLGEERDEVRDGGGRRRRRADPPRRRRAAAARAAEFQRAAARARPTRAGATEDPPPPSSATPRSQRRAILVSVRPRRDHPLGRRRDGTCQSAAAQRRATVVRGIPRRIRARFAGDPTRSRGHISARRVGSGRRALGERRGDGRRDTPAPFASTVSADARRRFARARTPGIVNARKSRVVLEAQTRARCAP